MNTGGGEERQAWSEGRRPWRGEQETTCGQVWPLGHRTQGEAGAAGGERFEWKPKFRGESERGGAGKC